MVLILLIGESTLDGVCMFGVPTDGDSLLHNVIDLVVDLFAHHLLLFVDVALLLSVDGHIVETLHLWGQVHPVELGIASQRAISSVDNGRQRSVILWPVLSRV